MDPIEVYASILPAVPYVLAAYALLWVILIIYVIISSVNLKKTQKQLAALEEALEQLERKSSKPS